MSDPSVGSHLPAPVDEPVEVVAADAYPLPPAPVVPPAQAAALAAGGFVAGAATAAMIRRTAGRRAARRRPRRAADLLPVVASRSFLVDVHLIGR